MNGKTYEIGVIGGDGTGPEVIGESIKVVPGCTLDRTNSQPATVDPIAMDVLFGAGQSFECRFPPTPAGSYSIKATAEFPFETWAYIPYTFVDEESARAFARQGRDIKQVLGITEQPIAVYTGGPITVGMGGSPQPILVRPTQDPILAPGSRIGVTLDTGWQSGRIKRVDTLELKVPQPFSLDTEKCDRKLTGEPVQDPKDDQYTDYTFTNPQFDVVTTYTSVTCPLVIDKSRQDDALKLVTSGDKAVRSFIARAHYTYVVEQKTSVQVK